MTSVLIIGSGAREFIFAKTFAQSVDQVLLPQVMQVCVRLAMKRLI
ncbi:Uncharacterised protein [Weissella viridescens]|uniref:Uncharacterized protein n=1 Tax=Weissella viridescens TaxID=1629 RepID=A0A380P0V1_WEIVI|nr:Uncharacterised protein [Weissella viridescens]